MIYPLNSHQTICDIIMYMICYQYYVQNTKLKLTNNGVQATHGFWFTKGLVSPRLVLPRISLCLAHMWISLKIWYVPNSNWLIIISRIKLAILGHTGQNHLVMNCYTHSIVLHCVDPPSTVLVCLRAFLIAMYNLGTLYYIYTLWLFNIAMENGPFIDGLPIKNGDFPWLC